MRDKDDGGELGRLDTGVENRKERKSELEGCMADDYPVEEKGPA